MEKPSIILVITTAVTIVNPISRGKWGNNKAHIAESTIYTSSKV